MTKRELIEDPNSCLNRAQDDEPVFLLVAHDRVAPAAVRDWGHRARAIGSPQEKVNSGMECALQMDNWQRTHQALVKVPD